MALTVSEEARVGILADMIENEWYRTGKNHGPDRVANWARMVAWQWLTALGAPVLSEAERDALGTEVRERIFPAAD